MTTRTSGGLHLERRLAAAAGFGVAIAAVLEVVVSGSILAGVLIGYVVTSLAFCIPLLARAFDLDGEQTTAVLDGVDPTRSVTDILVLVSAFAALGGIGTVLVSSKKSDATVAARHRCPDGYVGLARRPRRIHRALCEALRERRAGVHRVQRRPTATVRDSCWFRQPSSIIVSTCSSGRRTGTDSTRWTRPESSICIEAPDKSGCIQ